MLLKQLALRHYNCSLDAIVPAPRHTTLSAFGGNLTIEEFRQGNTQIRIETPPLIPRQCLVLMQPKDAQPAWSVYGLRRATLDSEPAETQIAGKRGMYYDYIKNAAQMEVAPQATPATTTRPNNSLAQFMLP